MSKEEVYESIRKWYFPTFIEDLNEDNREVFDFFDSMYKEFEDAGGQNIEDFIGYLILQFYVAKSDIEELEESFRTQRNSINKLMLELADVRTVLDAKQYKLSSILKKGK